MAGVGRANTLRMSGMNSGLDTESIVNAMTAATKLRITQNKRKVMKLESQQEAYRGVIDKVTEFKNKYFDILNSSSYLKGSTGFGKYAAKVSSNGTETTPSGVKVTTNSAAIPANYKVEVTALATQSKYTSTSTNSLHEVKLDEFNNNETYAMKVTVGDKTKVIAFDGGADDDATLENINNALKKAFGASNDGEGMVSIVEENGKYVFNSLEKKAITTSGAVNLQESVDLGTDFQNSTNNITVTIAGETKTISLSTVPQDYFDKLFDESGNYLDAETIEGDNELKILDARFKQCIEGMYQNSLGESYEAFMENDPGYRAEPYDPENETWDEFYSSLSVKQQELFDSAVANRQDEQWNNAYDKMAEDLYNSLPAGKITGGNYVPYNQWLDDFKANYTLDEFKDDRSGWQDRYNNAAENAYTTAVGDGTIAPEDLEDLTQEDLDAHKANWISDWKKTTSLTQFQKNESEADYTARYNDLAENEYKLYKAYVEERNSALEDGEDPVELVGETEWINNWKEAYTLDMHSTAMAKGDVVVAEAGAAFYSLSYNEYSSFVKNEYSGPSSEEFLENYKNDPNAATKAASFYNEASLSNSIDNVKFSDGTTLKVNFTKDDVTGKITGLSITASNKDENGDPIAVKLAATSTSGSYDFGLDKTTANSNTLSSSTKLSELGINPSKEAVYKDVKELVSEAEYDSNNQLVKEAVYKDVKELVKEAQYEMDINGVKFSFNESMTVGQMMSQINSSPAGVTMTFSSLTNTFEIATKEYGKDHDLEINTTTGGSDNLLSALGFNSDKGADNYKEGSNLSLKVNGLNVETSSNSYTIDGTTFSFNSLTEVGTKFDVEVSLDQDKIKDLVKDFVKDYNDLIKFVYGYVDEKPAKDYHFLTDEDKEEMALSENQEKLWDQAAKKGILYNDSTLNSMMSKFRTALYSSGTGIEGNNFGLYSMGITTTANYKAHGTLQINEDTFNEAFEKNYNDIVELFTNNTNGIMTQFDKIIDQSIKATGEKGTRGTLVEKAGVANGSSTTDNLLYDQIKTINTLISSLQKRYDQQQDRYWSIYTNLEKQMGTLNGQTSYISQMMGMGGQ